MAEGAQRLQLGGEWAQLSRAFPELLYQATGSPEHARQSLKARDNTATSLQPQPQR